MKKLKKYLKSTNFGTVLLIGTVFTQCFHSYFVFADLSNFSSVLKIISSLFYAVVISSAILYFIMLNKRKIALTFQLFESSINLYYFFKGIVIMLMLAKISWLEVVPRSIIAIGIALILPYTIVAYAGSVSEEEDDGDISYYKRKQIEKKLLDKVNTIDEFNKLKNNE